MRILVLLCVLLVSMLLGGLIFFVNQMPKSPLALREKLGAIVVLTGGSQRIEYGIALLEAGLSDRMFITGVGVDVDVKDVIADIDPNTSEKITLGLRATDTAGNAIETKDWVEKEEVEAFYLVTSNYHMPRALLEFSKQLPNTQVVVAPVIPESVKVRYWWAYPGTLKLLLSEYMKVLAIHAGIKTGSYGKLS